MSPSSSSAPSSPHVLFFLALLPLRFADASSPEEAGAGLPEAFFLSLRDIFAPAGLTFPARMWLAGVVGREVSGVWTGVESALVSKSARCGGFCRAAAGALSSALSLSMLESGVVILMPGALESLWPSSSCICRSKYGPNLSQLTTLLSSVFNCSPYRPTNNARTLSSSLSIHVRCTRL